MGHSDGGWRKQSGVKSFFREAHLAQLWQCHPKPEQRITQLKLKISHLLLDKSSAEYQYLVYQPRPRLQA
jgi:hypothetical protein